ncbi:MAG: hypothetical protein AABW88_02510 [Nanoarchaeota archaeon]
MGNALAQLIYTCFIAYSNSHNGVRRSTTGPSSYSQVHEHPSLPGKFILVPFIGLDKAIEHFNKHKSELSRSYDKAEIFAVDKDREYGFSDLGKLLQSDKPIKTFNLEWVAE